VYWRVTIFYLASLFVVGLLIAYNDPELGDGSGTALSSPFVIAMSRAGASGFPSVVNAGVFTSALSSGAAYLYASSRILHGLAVRDQAPKIFRRTSNNGLPLFAIGVCAAFSALAFLNVASGSSSVLLWITNLTTVAGLFTWLSICISFIRFSSGMKAQGRSRKTLVYSNRAQPYLAWIGAGALVFLILASGFSSFVGEFSISVFLTAYLNVPIFLALFGAFKIYYKTRAWSSADMDLITGVPTIEQTETPELPPKDLLARIGRALM